MKQKICFAVQRYGLEVNGGAELYCRQIAEKMTPIYDVTVVTTCAVDYTTWRNVYTPGAEKINGVQVVRFPVDYTRDMDEFNTINGRYLSGQLPVEEQINWVIAQGPNCPQILDYIRDNAQVFDAFIFCAYLYYQSVLGVPLVGEKSILVPMAHDEPFIHMDFYRTEFEKTKAFMFLTPEEQQLVYKLFGREDALCAVTGAGVDVPQRVSPHAFRAKYGVGEEYIVYIGRIDEGKNCGEMFRYWRAYKERNPSPLKLVLMGKAVIPVPEASDIVNLGFVSDEDKFNALAGARFLLLPSHFESLSIVVLEAMKLRVPVLVSGHCEVLKGHCVKSGAGLYYENFMEFETAVNDLIDHSTMYRQMCANAPEYVKQNYNWSTIVQRLKELVEAL